MGFRKKYVLINFLLFILTYSLFRLLLFVVFYNYFSSLSATMILTAFLDGIRFDISIILTFVGLPLFLLNFPIFQKNWLRFLSIIISIEFLIMLLILSADIVYFNLVDRHVGEDILLITQDLDFIVDYAFGQYWYFVILIVAGFFSLIRIQFSLINKYFVKRKIKIIKEIIFQVLLILIIIAGIRGTTRGKPINVINAFGGGTSEYGNLVLNGVFTSYHVGRSSENINHSFYSDDFALEIAVSAINEHDEIIDNSDYPLSRRRSFLGDSIHLTKPNIIFILLESWTPDFIDSFGNNDYGVTPNFDSIANNGLKFTNFYANGDRSIHGITASLLAVPIIPGVPYLGIGLEIQNIFRMGNILKENGYSTNFSQTSNRGSYRMDIISAALGFNDYYGRQDYPLLYDYMTDEIPHFGWDYEGLMFLNEKLDDKKEPFYSFFFTGTTHSPYILADDRFEKYPHESTKLNGYLNTLYYSDWALGEFFEKAKTKPWFDNTIFILTADHISNIHDKSLYKKLRIPMVIYGPSFFEAKEINALCSQADIPSTICDLIGFRGNYSGIGKSLIRDYENRFVISRKGNTLVIFTDKGYIQHSLKDIVKFELTPDSDLDTAAILKEMEIQLLSIDQTLYTLFHKNRFYQKRKLR